MSGGDELSGLVTDLGIAEGQLATRLLYPSGGDELAGGRPGVDTVDGAADGDAGLHPRGQDGHAAGHVRQGEQDAAVGAAPAVQGLGVDLHLHLRPAVVHGHDLHVVVHVKGLAVQRQI